MKDGGGNHNGPLLEQGAGLGLRMPRFARLRPWLTFKNITIALGALTLLIFIGSAVSARIAFLFAALLAVALLMGVEMVSRRKWEAEMTAQVQRMAGDYERLVREVARSRNDMAVLKKALSDAGTRAQSFSRGQDAGVEQRMLRALAGQLAQLGAAEDDNQPHFDFDRAGENMNAGDAAGRNLSDAQVLELVEAAVKQDRIDMFMQPIVALPQRKQRFFEMFSRIRIRDDLYLPAERYIEVAIKKDLAPAIDNLLLLRSLQLVREEAGNVNALAFFCNITSLTLNDPKFMGDLVEFIAQYRDLAPRLVFELGQRDLATMDPESLPVLEGLTRLGCRFSMDRVQSVSFDYAQLNARHIRFIKVESGLLLRELAENGGLRRLKRIKQELDTNGIDLIVEKIESEKQLVDLLDIDIDYGQGFLFGHPLPPAAAEKGYAA